MSCYDDTRSVPVTVAMVFALLLGIIGLVLGKKPPVQPSWQGQSVVCVDKSTGMRNHISKSSTSWKLENKKFESDDGLLYTPTESENCYLEDSAKIN